MHDETRTTQILMGVAVVAFLALLALAIGHDVKGDGGVEGTTWVLETVSAGGDEGGVLPGTELTVVFDGGEINGSAGCNSYFGSYELDGETITIGPLASTQMFCPDPPLVMDQELAYLELLQSMDEVVTATGDELVLVGSGTEARFGAG